MSRHTIGNKRGSVRGAPPDVYIGFGTYTNENDREPWEDAFRLIRHFGAIIIIWVLMVFFFWIAVAFGWLPKDIVDQF